VDLLEPVKLKISGFLRSEDQRISDPAEYQPVDAKNLKKEYQADISGSYEEGGYISVVAGYEGDYRSIDSNEIGSVNRQNSAFDANASLKAFGGTLVVNGGGRLDNNSQYGSLLSWNGDAKYRFKDGLEMRGAVEDYFSLPSFSDVYGPAETFVYQDPSNNQKCAVLTGNEGLKPEEFMSYEAGLRKVQEKLSESAVWFLRDSKNMIEWTDSVQGITTTSRPENVQKATTMGLEVKVDLTPFDFFALSAQYNLLFIEDANNNTGTSYVLGGNCNNKNYRLDASFKLPFDIKLGIAANYVDYKKDYRGRALNPYFLLDARATQKLNENINIALQVDNILDNKAYQTVSGYPMPGRIVSASAGMVF
jgi:outer membrane cobalamin receptor